MGIRLAAAMGNEVTAISTSPAKEAVAKEIGAKNFVISKDETSMAAAAKSLDLILNTVSADHQVSTYLPLLDWKGVIVQLGAAMKPHQLSQIQLMYGANAVASSLIGGMRDTQECIDFCSKNTIVPATELITWDKIEDVYKTLEGGNDRVVRYVLDLDRSFEMKK